MSAEPSEMPVEPPSGRRWLHDGALLLIAAGLLIAVRLHAFDLPLETDECYYVYFADRLLDGDRLYIDVWDHQPPGVFVLFAAAIAVFGDGPTVFRWMAVAASLATLVLIWAIVRRTAGRRPAGLAALLFALCNADPGMAGEGCNREILMNAFALVGVWLLLRRRTPGWGDVCLSGLAFGLGSTIKTVMAAQWLLLAVWLAVCFWRGSGSPRRLRIVAARVGAFAAGPIAVWAVTFGYFAATGRFSEFVDAVFVFNLGYSGGAGGYVQRFADFFANPVYHHIFDSSRPLWIAAGLAAVVLPVIRRGRGFRDEGAVLCYLLGSFWAVCLPGQFWPHYYYLMLPPLVLVLAAALGHLAALPTESRLARPGRWVAVGGTAVIVLSLVVLQARDYLLVPTLRITDQRYDSRDLWARAQGDNVARVTDPDDTVLVYGNDAGVYYYSRRRCASRFTMVFTLGEEYPGYQKRRTILLEEVESRRPRVVLLVEEPFPRLAAYLQENYYLVGEDYHDRRPDEVLMAALMDKSRSVKPIDWNWHRSSVLE